MSIIFIPLIIFALVMFSLCVVMTLREQGKTIKSLNKKIVKEIERREDLEEYVDNIRAGLCKAGVAVSKSKEYRLWLEMQRSHDLPRYGRPYPQYEISLIMSEKEIQEKMTKRADTTNKVTKK